MYCQWGLSPGMSFNILIWTIGICNSSVDFAYKEVVTIGELLATQSMPIMISAVFIVCSPQR